MSESLRDQLLKSGLASTLKKSSPRNAQPSTEARPGKPSAPRGKPAKSPSRRHPPKRNSEEVDLARAYALRARQENDERKRLQREAERIAREKKERKQKLTALLSGKALNVADAEVPRHFPHGNKIRRIYCTTQQLAQLNAGELAVVQLAGRYLLVVR
ncbi:MAG: DUF2058 family protein, partial [Rudaea sp.]